MCDKNEKAKELFKQGYNCTQSVLGVYCEELGLDFETAMKLASGFGGGMGRMREVCGTVTGMFMIAGLVFSKNNPPDHKSKTELYKKIQELAQIFKEKNGSIICRELLQGIENSNSPIPSKRTEDYYKKRPCIELVGDAVQILGEYFEENLEKSHN